MKFKKEQFIEIFKEEALGYIAKLNSGLLALEKNPKDRTLFHELMRAAHTLKGASRMMGFQAIHDVSHRLESFFSECEVGKKAFESHFLDSLFYALDELKKVIENIAQGKEEGLDVEALLSKMADIEERKTVLEKKNVSQKPKLEVISTPKKEEKKKIKDVVRPQEFPKELPREFKEEQEEYIRVPLSRIHEIVNLIAEMTSAKIRESFKLSSYKVLSQKTRKLEKNIQNLKPFFQGKSGALQDMEGLATRIREDSQTCYDITQDEVFHMAPILEGLQSKMKELRIVPLSSLFEQFPRMVRDIAKEEKKNIGFEIQGQQTELDKVIVDGLKAPLIHILRNAVDHGIENEEERIKVGKPPQGKIKLSAFQEGGKVVIEVFDDGRGIDPELIQKSVLKKKLITEDKLSQMGPNDILNLIFLEGFSTSPLITDVSGRGIGLTVARTEVERFRGEVFVKTEVSKGTTLRLELPLTVAILQVLRVQVSGFQWALPLSSIIETVQIKKEALSTIENCSIIHLREEAIALVSLAKLLGRERESEGKKEDKETLLIVIVKSIHGKIGLMVDKILGEEEVHIKGLTPHIGKVRRVSGTAVLGSGEVLIILESSDLVRLAKEYHPSLPTPKILKAPAKKKILVVEDSLTTRELEKAILENFGYEVQTALDGIDALQRLSQASFDLIVSDIAMPRLDGFEMCKSIRKDKNLKEIPLIFVTALSNEEEKKKGIEVGAQAYIIKGQFDQGNLLETIERLL